MAASLAALPLLPPPPSSAPHRPLLLAPRFPSPGALLGTKRSPSLGNGFKLRTRPSRRLVPVASARPDWLRVIQTAWKVGKDGIEAGANLVPDTIPKPVARICVAAVAGTVFLFLAKSLLSTAFFVLVYSKTTFAKIFFSRYNIEETSMEHDLISIIMNIYSSQLFESPIFEHNCYLCALRIYLVCLQAVCDN